MLAQCFLFPLVLCACAAKYKFRRVHWLVITYIFLKRGRGYRSTNDSVPWHIYGREVLQGLQGWVNYIRWLTCSAEVTGKKLLRATSCETALLLRCWPLFWRSLACFHFCCNVEALLNQHVYAVTLKFQDTLGIGRFLLRWWQWINHTNDSGHLWLSICCIWEFLFQYVSFVQDCQVKSFKSPSFVIHRCCLC